MRVWKATCISLREENKEPLWDGGPLRTLQTEQEETLPMRVHPCWGMEVRGSIHVNAGDRVQEGQTQRWVRT